MFSGEADAARAVLSTVASAAGSAGGRTATFSYFYQGPNVNTESGQPLLTSEQALKVLFDWFFENGGLDRATRNAPSIPGVTVKVADGLRAPNSNEYMVGLTRQIGNRGTVRADYLHREFADFYGDFRNTSTGKVTDPTSPGWLQAETEATGWSVSMDLILRTTRSRKRA